MKKFYLRVYGTDSYVEVLEKEFQYAVETIQFIGRKITYVQLTDNIQRVDVGNMCIGLISEF